MQSEELNLTRKKYQYPLRTLQDCFKVFGVVIKQPVYKDKEEDDLLYELKYHWKQAIPSFHPDNKNTDKEYFENQAKIINYARDRGEEIIKKHYHPMKYKPLPRKTKRRCLPTKCRRIIEAFAMADEAI